ncbi:MAG: hypothetical protein M0Z31_12500 [Clostridia bacterium]|nr:hypothetical protein [Clostridia bacterium]
MVYYQMVDTQIQNAGGLVHGTGPQIHKGSYHRDIAPKVARIRRPKAAVAEIENGSG